MREPSTEEVLASMTESDVTRIMDLVPDEVELPVPPREGLVLMTCREGLGSRFHLGEVLVSQCRVEWNGVSGWSMVMGGDTRRALAGAAIDAARRMDPPHPLLPSLLEVVDESRRRLLDERTEESRLSASTRVEFDLMPGA